MKPFNPNFLVERRKILAGTNEKRMSGRTIAIAMESIGKAMRNPGEVIEYQDHGLTNSSNRHLSDTIMEIIDSLGLSGFYVDAHLRRIIYRLEG